MVARGAAACYSADRVRNLRDNEQGASLGTDLKGMSWLVDEVTALRQQGDRVEDMLNQLLQAGVSPGLKKSNMGSGDRHMDSGNRKTDSGNRSTDSGNRGSSGERMSSCSLGRGQMSTGSCGGAQPVIGRQPTGLTQGETRRKSVRAEAALTIAQAESEVEHLLSAVRLRKKTSINLIEEQKQWVAKHPFSFRFVLLPTSHVMATWNMIVLITALASGVLVPLDGPFSLSKRVAAVRWVNLCLEALNIVDVMVNFRKAYLEEGVLIQTPKMIAMHYARTFLLVDLLSAAPISWALWIYKPSSAEWGLGMLKFMHLTRWSRVKRLLPSFPWWLSFKLHLKPAVFSLTRIVVLMLYMFHVIGCLHVAVYRYERVYHFSGDLDTEDRCNGAGFDAEESTCLTENDWLPSRFRFTKSELPGPYDLLFGWSWAVFVTTGIGVPLPGTFLESVYIMVLVFFGFLFNSYAVGVFISAIDEFAATARELSHSQTLLSEFMVTKQLPSPLQKRILEYHRFMGIDTRENQLASLPQHLRIQSELVTNKALYLDVPFFTNFDLPQIKMLLPLIIREFAWPGKTITLEGAINDDSGLFLILEGFVRTSAKGRLTGVLTSPDFVGTKCLISDDPLPFTAFTVTLASMAKLVRRDFQQLLRSHPSLARSLGKFNSVKKDEETSRFQLENVKMQMVAQWRIISAPHRKSLSSDIDELVLASSKRDSTKTKQCWGTANRKISRVQSTANIFAAVAEERKTEDAPGGAPGKAQIGEELVVGGQGGLEGVEEAEGEGQEIEEGPRCREELVGDAQAGAFVEEEQKEEISLIGAVPEKFGESEGSHATAHKADQKDTGKEAEGDVLVPMEQDTSLELMPIDS